mmetsp:Transcript_32600/g.52835  ORF Transcript_32600/g.52835 Transcript_32600/m.52835 type:complete len:247 (-) Transcript_32600:925-1665(-)
MSIDMRSTELAAFAFRAAFSLATLRLCRHSLTTFITAKSLAPVSRAMCVVNSWSPFSSILSKESASGNMSAKRLLICLLAMNSRITSCTTPTATLACVVYCVSMSFFCASRMLGALELLLVAPALELLGVADPVGSFAFAEEYIEGGKMPYICLYASAAGIRPTSSASFSFQELNSVSGPMSPIYKNPEYCSSTALCMALVWSEERGILRPAGPYFSDDTSARAASAPVRFDRSLCTASKNAALCI